ncbi:MAG TPA: tetratricopeptide repeat protein [Candidatus Eisenbacteria bacterium]|nr:tetratricopeptide repeat protein [Candidatus Eisenbacteria bacterium]
MDPVSKKRKISSPPRRRPTVPADSRYGPWWAWLTGILVLTFAVYLPSLDNGFTNWDDAKYVTENLTLAHPSLHDILVRPLEGNYHPLTVLSLAWNYRLSQLHPASYHGLNLLLHLANTALVFFFIRKLAGGLWAPVVTSLFFGIHPMHVESVAWIAERKDVLFVFFYLAGLIAYLEYRDSKRGGWLAATLAACVLSLASKPAAVTFPVALMLVDAYRGRRFDTAAIVEKTPFFALAIVAGLLTLHAQKAVGAIVDTPVFPLFSRVLFAAYGTVSYVVKLLVPLGLSAIYPYPVGGRVGPEFYVAFAALVVLLPAAVYLFRHNRAVLFGLAFFLLNIALVLQFVTVGHALMADRYTYLPYVGLFFALSYWMDAGPPPWAPGSSVKTLTAGLLLLLVPVCAVQTWKRCGVWKDSATLWTDTIRHYPNRIYDAYFLRGTYYHHAVGDPAAALADYDEALKLNPRAAFALANKGTLLFDLGRADSAYVYLDRALQLKPDLAGALNNRGAIKGQRGDLPGAVADFSRAIASEPLFRDPYENRAVGYYMAGQFDKAIADTRRALELDPANPENHALWDAIGQYEQKLHRYQEAVTAHDEAIRRAPYGDPRIPGYYLNRSFAYEGLGNREAAIRDARQAEQLGATLAPGYLKKLGIAAAPAAPPAAP